MCIQSMPLQLKHSIQEGLTHCLPPIHDDITAKEIDFGHAVTDRQSNSHNSVSCFNIMVTAASTVSLKYIIVVQSNKSSILN